MWIQCEISMHEHHHVHRIYFIWQINFKKFESKYLSGGSKLANFPGITEACLLKFSKMSLWNIFCTLLRKRLSKRKIVFFWDLFLWSPKYGAENWMYDTVCSPKSQPYRSHPSHYINHIGFIELKKYEISRMIDSWYLGKMAHNHEWILLCVSVCVVDGECACVWERDRVEKETSKNW